jgi:hypothetical protein
VLASVARRLAIVPLEIVASHQMRAASSLVKPSLRWVAC